MWASELNIELPLRQLLNLELLVLFRNNKFFCWKKVYRIEIGVISVSDTSNILKLVAEFEALIDNSNGPQAQSKIFLQRNQNFRRMNLFCLIFTFYYFKY